jgi:hypothetical protein
MVELTFNFVGVNIVDEPVHYPRVGTFVAGRPGNRYSPGPGPLLGEVILERVVVHADLATTV